MKLATDVRATPSATQQKKKRNKKIYRTRTMPRMVIASEKRGRHTKSRVSTEEGYMLQQCLFPMAERKVAEKLCIHCYCVWFSLLLFHSFFLFVLLCFCLEYCVVHEPIHGRRWLSVAWRVGFVRAICYVNSSVAVLPQYFLFGVPLMLRYHCNNALSLSERHIFSYILCVFSMRTFTLHTQLWEHEIHRSS